MYWAASVTLWPSHRTGGEAGGAKHCRDSCTQPLHTAISARTAESLGQLRRPTMLQAGLSLHTLGNLLTPPSLATGCQAQRLGVSPLGQRGPSTAAAGAGTESGHEELYLCDAEFRRTCTRSGNRLSLLCRTRYADRWPFLNPEVLIQSVQPNHFYFLAPARVQVQGTQPAAVELAYWQSAERCGTAACLEEYLKKYPHGEFTSLCPGPVGGLGAKAPERWPLPGSGQWDCHRPPDPPHVETL